MSKVVMYLAVFIGVALAGWCQLGEARADDWTQWLGPLRNGVSKETGLLSSWPKQGPSQLWTHEVGPGFSGPVVEGDRVIIFHRQDKTSQEVVECLEASTGKKLWEFSYATKYVDSFGKGNGPRSTPVITDKYVVTLGAEGWLHCIDKLTGKKVWGKALLSEYEVPPNFFGVGTSPVVEDNLILINLGAKKAGIVAFALDTGKEVWKATDDQASYSSPVVRTVADKRQAFFFTRTGVVILDPKTGKINFEKRWRSRIDASVNAATPLVVDDKAFYSSSYSTGALLLQVGKDDVKELWSSDEVMSNHYNTCVYQDGYLYGFDGRQEGSPNFRCVQFLDGKVCWQVKDYGCGSMILADKKLILLTEAGDLVLVDPNPKAYRELARANVFGASPCRAQIALSNGRLFARDQRKLICFDLRSKQ